VIKEANSDSVSYSYYCTVQLLGDILDDSKHNEIQWVDVTYDILDLNDDSTGSMLFSEDVNMTYLEKHFYFMFKIFYRDINYRENKEDKNLVNFVIDHYGWNGNNSIVNFTMKFEKPYLIGLLLKKSDKLYINRRDYDKFNATEFFLNTTREGLPDYDADGVYRGNSSWHRFATNSTNQRLELIFDFRNPIMALYRRIASNMYWVMIALILTQFVTLWVRGVGFQPVWVLIEYLQLVSFMPIYNFRFIPYLYDAFKPGLVSHFIIFDETPFYSALDDDYFNKNYRNYWLSVGRLLQAFAFYIIILVVIIILNVVVWAIYRMPLGTVRSKQWIKRKYIQFNYNVYIRYYMLVYFDITFFSVMKIFEGENETNARKFNLLLSYVLFVVNIVLPVILITTIYRRFDILKIKEAKQSFNTLLLRLDKASKVRIVVPAYFFFRRCMTACLLTLPIDNTFIFLQYVFILMSSHSFVLFMVAIKPFQTAGINWYILANETFYSTLIIAMFIFSDATPEITIKFGAAVALISSLILIVLANLLTNIVFLLRGKDKLKQDIAQSKKKRAE
jgi:hypothetical protein